MTVLWIVLAVLAVLLIALYFVIRYFYRFAMDRWPDSHSDWWTADPATIPGPEHSYGPEELHDHIYQSKLWLNRQYREKGREYSILSEDGLRLYGHYIPPEGQQRGVFLQVHGYRSCGFHDFCGCVGHMTRDGFGCLVIDQRCHGLSEGDTICFGVRERYDILLWCRFIETEFPGMPVILDGVSMGAATVMAASALDLPTNVSGIIADCGYTSMQDIFNKVIRQKFRLPPFPLVPLAELYCRAKNGFGFSDVRSADCLAQAKVPVLLAHGEADNFVPYSMAVEIYEAVKDKIDIEFVSVRDAGHGLSYLVNYDQYYAALCRLYEKIPDSRKVQK